MRLLLVRTLFDEAPCTTVALSGSRSRRFVVSRPSPPCCECPILVIPYPLNEVLAHERRCSESWLGRRDVRALACCGPGLSSSGGRCHPSGPVVRGGPCRHRLPTSTTMRSFLGPRARNSPRRNAATATSTLLHFSPSVPRYPTATRIVSGCAPS